jgi:hypothetical protein
MTDVVTARPNARWTDAVICECGAVVILAAAIPLHRMGDVHRERMTARVVVIAAELGDNCNGAVDNCNGAVDANPVTYDDRIAACDAELPPVPEHRVPGYRHAMALHAASLRIQAQMERDRAAREAA